MSEALESIRRVVETIPTPAPDTERVKRTARRRARRRRITAGGVALVIAAAGLAFVVGALRDAGPRPATPATEGPLDPTTLTYAWSVRVEDTSAVGEVLQDADRIYVPTATGAVVYPKACSDPCSHVWSLDFVEPDKQVEHSMTTLALEGDLLAVNAAGRLAVVATDCGDGGTTCQPLWVADALPGTSGYFGPVISDGVVKATTNEGDAPDNRQTAVAFESRCRDDGGECQPLWRAELGSGMAHIPGVAVGGVFYQQVGTRMLGFIARCRTDGAACEPDFVVESTGDPQTQESSLYGPIPHEGTLVLASGDGRVSGYPEHCGTSCQPEWSTPVADYLENPMAAGEVVVVAHDGGIVALPLSCRGSCAPSWEAALDGFWIEYADANVVVATTRFRESNRIAVLPVTCSDPCQPIWTYEVDGELYGVGSDGMSVFASDGRRVLSFPAACSNPCSPVWSADLVGEAWGFLMDDRNLVVTSRLGPVWMGIDVTVFAGDPRSPSEEPPVEGAGYEVADVALDEVTTGDDGTPSAIVSYEIMWSGEEWPGYVRCRIDLIDAAGTSIGGLDLETGSLRPNPPLATIDVPFSSGVPATATMSCGEAYRPSASAGYVISNPVVVGSAQDPRLVFDVSWATDEPPLYQACEAELRRTDGTVGSYAFGLSVPTGRSEVLLTPEYAGAIVVDVSCHSFRSRHDEAPLADDVTSVDPMPSTVLLNASTELIPELEKRLRVWVARLGAEAMSEQEIVDTMDALTRAMPGGDETEDEWVQVRELMMRRTYLCEQLPSNHSYRGGEYCH